MMTLRLVHLFVAAVTLFGVTVVHADGTAHSLDKARSKLDTTDARKAYDQEMGNTPEADGFGTHLPAGFTRQIVLAQLTPGQDPARAVLVGVKPWPQRSGTYVAIVCMAPTDDAAKRTVQFRPPLQCDGDDPNDETGADGTRIWLGVFERGTDAAPRLIARTAQPVDQETDWSDTNLDGPDYLDSVDSGRTLRPAEWRRFDLAPYLLHAGDYAFGVRAGWNVGYAGGGASFEALYLFRIDGSTLRLVFAQPMTFFRDIAGDWHRDGTRDHEMTDGSNALSVLATSTDGYRDWQLRQRGGPWRQTFHWSSADGKYVAR